MPEIRALLRGYHRFREEIFKADHARYEQLVREGQHPHTCIIACSDSRVDPVMILDARPGDLFVIRNVANLIPPWEPQTGSFHGTSAGLEYAVCNLQVRNVVVMGHSHCGGITALLEGYGEHDEGEGFIAPWVGLLRWARERVLRVYPEADGEVLARACERTAVEVSLDNLLSFPFIAKRVEAGTLRVLGWYFDIEQGYLFECQRGWHRFDAAPMDPYHPTETTGAPQETPQETPDSDVYR